MKMSPNNEYRVVNDFKKKSIILNKCSVSTAFGLKLCALFENQKIILPTKDLDFDDEELRGYYHSFTGPFNYEVFNMIFKKHITLT